MDITPRIAEGAKLIDGYGDGGFRVQNVRYEQTIFVMPDQLQLREEKAFAELAPEAFQQLSELFSVEIMLIGTGAKQQFLANEQAHMAQQLPFSIDCMETGAACRTYNVLLAEGRQVAALLFPV